jgi:CRP-like cAMP-binding protein
VDFAEERPVSGLTRDERKTLFGGHPLFGGLDPGDLDTLLSHGRVKRHPAGHEIFEKGAPGGSLIAVLRGSIRISSRSPQGKEVVLNIINSGEVFGEITLLDGGKRTGTAITITDCDLFVLDRRDFVPFLERHPHVCLLLLSVLSQRLRQTSEQVEHILFQPLRTRIAKALLRLADRVEDRNPGAPVTVRISQQQLGNMAGSTRESVNKQLRAWQSAGLVEIVKGAIVIRDIRAFQHRA